MLHIYVNTVANISPSPTHISPFNFIHPSRKDQTLHSHEREGSPLIVYSLQVFSDELHWWCSTAMMMYRPLQPGDDGLATGAFDHQMLIGLGR